MSPDPAWIDTHAHLDDRRLRDQLAEVLARARAAGVVQVVAAATTAASSAAVVGLAEAHPGVFAAVGLHPNDLVEAGSDDWAQVVALARSGHPRIVALGETGLDRYWDRTPFDLQKAAFQRHLQLAHERDLAVIIHCRDCEHDIIEQLRELGRPVRGVLHSFTGTWDDAQALLDLGLYLSFAGQITFENKGLAGLREVAARVPVDRLLVETDSPYLSPHPYRGQTNEPARVAVTGRRLAELLGRSPAETAQLTTRNARLLFGLPEAPAP